MGFSESVEVLMLLAGPSGYGNLWFVPDVAEEVVVVGDEWRLEFGGCLLVVLHWHGAGIGVAHFVFGLVKTGVWGRGGRWLRWRSGRC